MFVHGFGMVRGGNDNRVVKPVVFFEKVNNGVQMGVQCVYGRIVTFFGSDMS